MLTHKMTVTDGVETAWKEAIVAYFRVHSQNSPWRTEFSYHKNKEKRFRIMIWTKRPAKYEAGI